MAVTEWGRKPIDVGYFEGRSFWSRVERRGTTECWPWTQSVGSHGYGQVTDGVAMKLAHRVAWVLANERQLPVGMTVDHRCHNRTCCNPLHLRILSNQRNAADNGNATKTHCPRGHEYTPENTRRDKRGHRFCRACQDAYNASRYAA